MKHAGFGPVDLGYVDLNPTEMMFCMYMPISEPGMTGFLLPDNLKYTAPLLVAVRDFEPRMFADEYVYLTAKTLYVEGSHIGNRPGWHIDGFGTGDINFIWSDRAPTEFLTKLPCQGSYDYCEDLLSAPSAWTFSDDCDLSLAQMERLGEFAEAHNYAGLRTYPDKHLLRLDDLVIHRSPKKFEPGIRTFIKVSISRDRYNLKGNAVNYRLPATHWPLVDRETKRNHPTRYFQ